MNSQSSNSHDPNDRPSLEDGHYDEDGDYITSNGASLQSPIHRSIDFPRSESFLGTLHNSSPIFHSIDQHYDDANQNDYNDANNDENDRKHDEFDDNDDENSDTDQYDESETHNPPVNPSDYQSFGIVSPPFISQVDSQSFNQSLSQPNDNVRSFESTHSNRVANISIDQPTAHSSQSNRPFNQPLSSNRPSNRSTSQSTSQSSKRSIDESDDEQEERMRDAGSMGLFGEEDSHSINQSSDASLPRSSGDSMIRMSDQSINPFVDPSINQSISPQPRPQTVTPLSSINQSISPGDLLSPVHRSGSSSSDQSDQSINSQSISDSDDDQSTDQSINQSNESDDPTTDRFMDQSDQSIGNSQSDDQSSYQSNDQSADSLIDQSDQSIDQSTDRSTDQSTDQSIDPSIDQSADQSVDRSEYEFAVPEVPLTGRKRQRQLDEFNQSFSVPSSFKSVDQSINQSLQIPSNIALANVSPVSQEFAGLRYQSTLPQPIVPVHPNSNQSASQSLPSYSSPPQSYSSGNQAMNQSINQTRSPISNSFIPPSSPRQDLIPSITSRIDVWHRSGLINMLINNANRMTDEYRESKQSSSQSTNASNTSTPHPSPSPQTARNNRPSTNQSINRSSNSQSINQSLDGLLSVDRYLRRRYVFSLLDSDLVVNGVVYSKTSDGLLITITQVCWPQSLIQSINQPTNSQSINQPMSPPILSSASIEKEDDLDHLEELGIRGECHLSEIQAAIINEIRSNNPTINQSINQSTNPTTGGKSVPSEQSSASILDSFTIGDQVKALVISVDTFSEKVYLSMNNARLRNQSINQSINQSQNQSTNQKLGPYRDSQSPSLKPLDHPSIDHISPRLDPLPMSSINQSINQSFSLDSTSTTAPSNSPHTRFLSLQRMSDPLNTNQSINQSTNHSFNQLLNQSTNQSINQSKRHRKRPKHFLPWLRRQSVFFNPAGLSFMFDAYGINQSGTLLPMRLIDSTEYYDSVRTKQDQRWARESVAKGILCASEGKYETALRVYQHAALIEPKLATVYIARGAVYILMNRVKQAITQFQKACELDPQSKQAKAYLNQSINQLEQQRQETANIHSTMRMKRPRNNNQSINQSLNQSFDQTITVIDDSEEDENEEVTITEETEEDSED